MSLVNVSLSLFNFSKSIYILIVTIVYLYAHFYYTWVLITKIKSTKIFFFGQLKSPFIPTTYSPNILKLYYACSSLVVGVYWGIIIYFNRYYTSITYSILIFFS